MISHLCVTIATSTGCFRYWFIRNPGAQTNSQLLIKQQILYQLTSIILLRLLTNVFKYTCLLTFPSKHTLTHTLTQPCRNMQVGLSPRLLTLNLIRFQSHGDGQMDTVQFLEFLTFSAFAGSCCCLSRFYRLSPGISTPIGGLDCSDIISAGFPLWLALKPLSPTLSSSLRLQTNSNPREQLDTFECVCHFCLFLSFFLGQECLEGHLLTENLLCLHKFERECVCVGGQCV